MLFSCPAIVAWSVILGILSVCPSAREAWAKGPNVSSNTAPLTTGPLITDTAVPIGAGHFTVQPFGFFSLPGGRFTADWTWADTDADRYSIDAPLRLIYGPSPNTEIYLIVPYVHNWVVQAQPPGSGGVRSADAGGIGDSTFTAKYRLIGTNPGSLTITALGTIGFPTGKHEHLDPRKLGADKLGDGAYSLTLGLNSSTWIEPVLYYAIIWYTINSAATIDEQRVFYRDKITMNTAAEISLSPRFILFVELDTTWQWWRLLGPEPIVPVSALVKIAAGLEFILNDRWNFLVGATVDVAGKDKLKSYAPAFTLLFNL